MRRFYHDARRAETVTKWPLVAMMLTAMFCLGASTFCHTYYCQSHKISRIVSCLDYWGISILFLGTTYPFISFKYACGPYIVWRYIFVSIITVMTGLCMYVTMSDKFLSPKPRVTLFVIFGLSTAIPTFGLAFWGDSQYTLDANLIEFSYALLAYIIGLGFYVSRVPECLSKTGRYDFFGHSHQIFHCFVLLGVALTIWDAFNTYEKRLAFVCPD